MSSTIQSKNTEKRVKSPDRNSVSKSDCEVSSSSKTIESKIASNSKERTKENTESTNVLQKIQIPSNDSIKMESKSTDTKMNSDQTNRNPLTESTPSNNESNRKNSVGSDNKTPKLGTNETNNNNNPKLRTRPGKKSTSPTQMSECGWCSDIKPILKYILPTLSGENLQFCSENCIAEFRKAVKKGACKQCGNAVRSSIAPNKEYCSTFCMNKAMPKNGKH